jgi:hypothetical protein
MHHLLHSRCTGLNSELFRNLQIRKNLVFKLADSFIMPLNHLVLILLSAQIQFKF